MTVPLLYSSNFSLHYTNDFISLYVTTWAVTTVLWGGSIVSGGRDSYPPTGQIDLFWSAISVPSAPSSQLNNGALSMSRSDGEDEDWPLDLIMRKYKNEVPDTTYPWLSTASLRDCSSLLCVIISSQDWASHHNMPTMHHIIHTQ